ncbi:MAG: methyltransferase domain-containing protein [Symploca sp. SIO1C4]|uniref:Methyltransferase domain-containing protein n=1 Tax=Symploca sp. SIO1C4 TaxID=2607765 RepID=A0A6B3NK18_9CYAN|nr:methyltransferase domain-containing protein [Symploca sp. SIO1C4]
MSQKQWNPQQYKKDASFVPKLGQHLLELLQTKPGERILDLGCGEGSLTLEIAKSGATVIGIDTSAEMVAVAQANGVDAYQMNATELDFEMPFDAVFSNAVLHWIKTPEKVLNAVHQHLIKKGRFVGEFGEHGNVMSAQTCLIEALNQRGIDGNKYDPWYYPSQEEYAELLDRNGFEVEMIELYQRPTPLGEDVMPWLKLFSDSFLQALPVSEHWSYLEEVARNLRLRLPKEDDEYILDYVRLKFVARKKE